MRYECPTCEKVLDTKHGLKVHHGTVHDKSLANTERCEECGESFDSPPNAERRFCGNDCEATWKSREMVGEKSSPWKGGMVEIECEICGEVFEVRRCREDTARFCSNECNGEWFSMNQTGDDHPRWEEGLNWRQLPMGRNWDNQRQKALERDNKECRICGISQMKCKLENPSGLHVHHIVKRRKFYDEQTDELNYEAANRLSNLITLCPTHHRLVETGRIDCPEPEAIDDVDVDDPLDI